MAPKKVDGVIEAVHYSPDGSIQAVRMFERRGPTYSDHLLINRDELVSRIKDGKVFYTGKRIAYMGGTFEFGQRVRLVNNEGKEYLVAGDVVSNSDNLELPLI